MPSDANSKLKSTIAGLFSGLTTNEVQIDMSEECVGEPCPICKKIIQSANYYCPKCKACVCFYCGAELLKEVDVTSLKCPRCRAELK